MRSIVPWPNKVLRSPAESVDQITDDIRAIWDEMVEVMDAMPGYGLAAVQFVMRERDPITHINRVSFIENKIYQDKS